MRELEEAKGRGDLFLRLQFEENLIQGHVLGRRSSAGI
jgi:hypothetical protein